MKNISFWCGVFGLILAASFTGIGQTPRVAAVIKEIPANAHNTKEFAPRGWEVGNEATGDLDGDGIPDAALTLNLPLEEIENLNDGEAAPSIIVLALGMAGGGYRRLAVSGRLYPADSDQRSPLGSQIEKGVLIINTNWGDGWASDITYRFRYDQTTGKMMLIGFDQERYDRTSIYEGHKSSENYVTGMRIDYSKSLHRKSSSYSETLRSKVRRSGITFETAKLTWDEDATEYRPY